MKRRNLLRGVAAGLSARAAGASFPCGCEAEPQEQRPIGSAAFEAVGSKIRITGVKTFGLSLTPRSDRPYVFVKIETDAGVIGWGEATLEGKAGAVMACVNDFHDFLIGADAMQVEHHWQSMYIHSFYRGGPVIGSAISGIDQALWDIRGKVLGLPVYKVLGGPFDPSGVRGYYHGGGRTREQLQRLRDQAVAAGVTCIKTGVPDIYEWIDRHAKIRRAVDSLALMREVLGPGIDIAVDFHAKTSPTVASVIIREIEPLNLLFVEEPCPPENVKALARIARRSRTPIATGERLVAPYSCREIVETGAADIIQTDINHIGGITALWKVAAMADAAGIAIAPHACEGPIGGLASIHVDAAVPNFLIQEYCGGVLPGKVDKLWEEWLGFPVMRMVQGRYPLPEKPGLGFELSENAFSKFPFGGTRPMARVFHQDGSVAEW